MPKLIDYQLKYEELVQRMDTAVVGTKVGVTLKNDKS